MRHKCLLFLSVLSASCVPQVPPAPRPIDPSIYADDCLTIYQQELGRLPDPGGLVNCEDIILRAKLAGAPVPQEVFRAFVREQPEWKARQDALKQVELPRLVPNGQFFMLETGQRWTVIESSDFALYDKWLNGIDIEPVLTQRAALGFNSVRIFGLGRGLAFPGYTIDLRPDKHGDRYFTKLRPFFQALARHHLYGSFVAFIGQIEIPTIGGQLAHWDRLNAYLRDIPNVLVSAMNEDNVHPLPSLLQLPKPVGVLASHGSNGGTKDGLNGAPPPTPYWDWIELHTNDTFERQRKLGHNCQELSDRHPCLASENTRADDRLTRASEAFDSAAGASLLAGGSTYHSLAGRSSDLFQGAQLDLATAWVEGAKSVPLSCQAGRYRHDAIHVQMEQQEGLLRVYQRGDDPACLVRIRR